MHNDQPLSPEEREALLSILPMPGERRKRAERSIDTMSPTEAREMLKDLRSVATRSQEFRQKAEAVRKKLESQ